MPDEQPEVLRRRPSAATASRRCLPVRDRGTCRPRGVAAPEPGGRRLHHQSREIADAAALARAGWSAVLPPRNSIGPPIRLPSPPPLAAPGAGRPSRPSGARRGPRASPGSPCRPRWCPTSSPSPGSRPGHVTTGLSPAAARSSHGRKLPRSRAPVPAPGTPPPSGCPGSRGRARTPCRAPSRSGAAASRSCTAAGSRQTSSSCRRRRLPYQSSTVPPPARSPRASERGTRRSAPVLVPSSQSATHRRERLRPLEHRRVPASARKPEVRVRDAGRGTARPPRAA